MTTRARQIRLMTRLGFTLKDGTCSPLVWWHSTGDVVVQISDTYCPSAAAVVDVAIACAARKALYEAEAHLTTKLHAQRRPFDRPLMMERKP